MKICECPRASQYSWITHLMDICMSMEQTQISYLSSGADTCIILSTSMDVHLHPYYLEACISDTLISSHL
jgi:hypothetical protein